MIYSMRGDRLLCSVCKTHKKHYSLMASKKYRGHYYIVCDECVKKAR